MIRSAKGMHKFEVVARDGRVGAIDDFYFDDESWAIRYVVVDTGEWLPGRQVLISPLSIDRFEWNEQRLLLSVSRKQVKDSPGIDTLQPGSRLTGDEARAIQEAQSYLREAPERHDVAVERRSRPR